MYKESKHYVIPGKTSCFAWLSFFCLFSPLLHICQPLTHIDGHLRTQTPNENTAESRRGKNIHFNPGIIACCLYT